MFVHEWMFLAARSLFVLLMSKCMFRLLATCCACTQVSEMFRKQMRLSAKSVSPGDQARLSRPLEVLYGDNDVPALFGMHLVSLHSEANG